MSWLRTAVHKAVVVGQKNKLSRIRSVADSVVQHAGHAVVGGAKLLSDRIGSRNVQSFKQTVKKLEELSVSCRGEERLQLLRRWLVSLKEAERISSGCGNDKHAELDSRMNEALVLYHDLDHGDEPLNFRDVFVHSEALEGIVMSMILEVPNDDEVVMLLEIFGTCLMGGKEVHSQIISNIQDLAEVFATYTDEVLMKREELLQYAQSSITGMKINADLARVDVEVSSFGLRLNQLEALLPSSEANGNTSDETTLAAAEIAFSFIMLDQMLKYASVNASQALKEVLAQVRVYSRLKALILERKDMYSGDSPETHAQKVDKLKILLESLASSTAKAENRIIDQRSHKEKALSFRHAKDNEVSQVEKELVIEIAELERQKEELEAQLRKVNSSLVTANARLQNAREERQQFNVASTEILQHLQTKEDELSKSVALCRTEADVVGTWISFMQNARTLQSACAKRKEEHVNDELGRYAEYFSILIMQILPAHKNELGNLMTRFKELIGKLKTSDRLDKVTPLINGNHDGKLAPARKIKNMEEEYLDLEAKLITAFSVVESIKQLYWHNGDFSRKRDQRLDLLLDSLEEIRDEFDYIDRPNLRCETPTKAAWGGAFSRSFKETPSKFKPTKEDYCQVQVANGEDFLDSDEERAILEADYLKIIRDNAVQEFNGRDQ